LPFPTIPAIISNISGILILDFYPDFEPKKGAKMKETLTAIFEKSPQGYIGYVQELPGANTQGATLEETKKNLIEAIHLVLEANRQLAEESISEKEIIKESLGTITV
jgi:predicted RNase H-like HicB family nuclease